MSVTNDFNLRFQSLTAAGVSPDLARESIAREMEQAASAFRAQVAVPLARPPAAVAPPPPAPKPAPIVASNYSAAELKIICRAHELAAQYHSGALVASSASASWGAHEAELDNAFGLTAKGAIGCPVTGAVQQFGVVVPSSNSPRSAASAAPVARAATPRGITAAEAAELDRAFASNKPTAYGTTVRGNVQTFGVPVAADPNPPRMSTRQLHALAGGADK